MSCSEHRVFIILIITSHSARCNGKHEDSDFFVNTDQPERNMGRRGSVQIAMKRLENAQIHLCCFLFIFFNPRKLKMKRESTMKMELIIFIGI